MNVVEGFDSRQLVPTGGAEEQMAFHKFCRFSVKPLQRVIF
jgi:hypothetical protein